MALKFVVDTSVIKRLGHPAVRQVVKPLAAAGEVARARITDLEVGYSARNELEWDHLVAALGAFELVESTASHHRRALQVQRLLTQRNQCGRKIPELLIAAAGEEHQLQSCTMTPASTSSQQSLATMPVGCASRFDRLTDDP
jgi:predicted nucleic acid-binding protein